GRTSRQKRTANVADQKNEKRDMHRRDPSAVHHNPWTNEQHRRANGSDQICKYCTTQKKQRVSNGAAWSFCSQVNPAGNNEERANDNHEGRVIDSWVEERGRVTNKEVIETNKAGENNANLVVVTLPVMLRDYRAESDC